MKREHGKVVGFAVAAVCFATVRYGLGYVADHGVEGLGMVFRFSYGEARTMLWVGDVLGACAVGAACLCMLWAMRLSLGEDRRDRGLLLVVVMLVFLALVLGLYG